MVKLMDDEVFKAFTTYAAVVIIKMLLMAPMTAFYRFSRGEVDVSVLHCYALSVHSLWLVFVMYLMLMLLLFRCHQNDLENIVPFVVIALLYTLTGPSLSSALLHFRVFAGSRIFHTLSYVCVLPQPCRALSWMIGMLSTFSMAYRVLSSVLVL
uniref:Microsomal glutathione S-transferase 1 n=1 Tax=Labrus bergylta TaxID=56723 RepID=A0A3Q3L1N8_9LABR